MTMADYEGQRSDLAAKLAAVESDLAKATGERPALALDVELGKVDGGKLETLEARIRQSQRASGAATAGRRRTQRT